MENPPNQTGYDTEMKRVERLGRIVFRTIDPHYQWQNKAENMIKIIDVVQPPDVPFGIILWYIAKIIPTLLE